MTRTLEKRFGGWASVPQAFRNFARGKREWAGVVALLPASERKEEAPGNQDSRSSTPPNGAQRAQLRDRRTYGDPMDFRGLRHEPANEQGVIFLFGMLARELGYMVEGLCKRGSPIARPSAGWVRNVGSAWRSNLNLRA